MIAVLGTLPFLATIWLIVVLGAAVLEESGGKIAAALKGAPVHTPTLTGAVRRKASQPRPQGAPARQQWRAAA